ncbi:MAG: class I SAM-dependent methyltransferase [Desulfoferrobacter sp.]
MRGDIETKFEKVKSHCRILGFWNTFKYGLAGLLVQTRDDQFDRKYGTDTKSVVSMRYDEIPEPGQRVRSISTHPKVLKYILTHLNINYPDFIFTDFGCGKGRALLCASDFPFKRIVGIEWSQDISRIAKRNIEIYKSRRIKCQALEVHCMDVLEYQLPTSNTILYMYDPFGPKIVREVFAKIHGSLLANPRRFLIVYCGIGEHTDGLLRECFDRFGIRPIHKCQTLTPWASWLLAEARCGSGSRRRYFDSHQ